MGMLLRMVTSMSKPQPQLRRSLPIKLRLRRRPRKPLPPRKKRRRPPLPKLPQLSFNSTEEETSPKRELLPNLNPNPNHLDQTPPHQATAHHQAPTETQLDHIDEEKLTFSDREFVLKEFK